MNCDLRFAIWSRRLAAVALTASSFCIVHSAFGQGALTPPGAPAPTMKTLDQIEPRTPVDAAHTPGDSLSTFIIAQPGSYYLTTNIFGAPSHNGVIFRTNNITLDLNGFALIGAGSGVGVATPLNLTNLVVRNGTLRDWGTGVDTTGNRNTVVENVLVTHSLGSGIILGSDSIARNCQALANGNNGISAEPDSLLIDCTSSGNGSSGFIIGNDSAVENCIAQHNASAGILALGNRARIDGNHCGNNNYGVDVVNSGGDNVVVRNTLIGNTNDIVVPSGNKVGPIVSDPSNSSANAWANIITSLLF